MRRWICLLASAALVLGGALVIADPAAASGPTSTLHPGQRLTAGQRLVSANGHYRALITTANGRLIVERTNGVWLWNTPDTKRGAYVTVGGHGGLVIKLGRKIVWAARTSGSGADLLTMRNDGGLALTAHGASVWSTRATNACPRTTGRTFVVDLSQQRARMCTGGQQLRTSLVTTGASAHGNGTPKGTWHVQARVRNTTLYPAAGGAYPVKYWLPYDGAYGIHDSRWQTFPYGSSRYRTQGSHGCIHVPGPMMAWLFGWARVGTTVTVHG